MLLASVGCAASPPGAAPAATVERTSTDGRQLYIAKCAKCHKLYDPASYSDAEWKIWMSKMSRKARLKPQQEQAIVAYVNQELRPPAK